LTYRHPHLSIILTVSPITHIKSSSTQDDISLAIIGSIDNVVNESTVFCFEIEFVSGLRTKKKGKEVVSYRILQEKFREMLCFLP
jgi:hypothetical protein